MTIIVGRFPKTRQKDLKRQEAKGRNVKALYEAKMAERRIDTLETKLKEVNKLNLTTEEKALERDRLRQEIKKYKELRNQFLQKNRGLICPLHIFPRLSFYIIISAWVSGSLLLFSSAKQQYPV